jgi:hypothetical protein
MVGRSRNSLLREHRQSANGGINVTLATLSNRRYQCQPSIWCTKSDQTTAVLLLNQVRGSSPASRVECLQVEEPGDERFLRFSSVHSFLASHVTTESRCAMGNALAGWPFLMFLKGFNQTRARLRMRHEWRRIGNSNRSMSPRGRFP